MGKKKPMAKSGFRGRISDTKPKQQKEEKPKKTGKPKFRVDRNLFQQKVESEPRYEEVEKFTVEMTGGDIENIVREYVAKETKRDIPKTAELLRGSIIGHWTLKWIGKSKPISKKEAEIKEAIALDDEE